MKILVLLPFAIVAVPADAAPRATPCKPGAGAAGAATPVIGARKLGDMPDASAIRTVYKEVDGCPTPVVLRNGIGSNPTAPRAPVDGQSRAIPLR